MMERQKKKDCPHEDARPFEGGCAGDINNCECCGFPFCTTSTARMLCAACRTGEGDTCGELCPHRGTISCRLERGHTGMHEWKSERDYGSRELVRWDDDRMERISG